MIKRSKHSDNKPDFDEVLDEVDQEIECQQAEQNILDHVQELKKLSTHIEKATTACINATLELESTIRIYKTAEMKLEETKSSVRYMVDSINGHIDNTIKDAPAKLHFTVDLSDECKKEISNSLAEVLDKMKAEMQKHLRETNIMLAGERRHARDKFREYDGIWFGYYGQWFFLPFFYIGIFIVLGVILTLIIRQCC